MINCNHKDIPIFFKRCKEISEMVLNNTNDLQTKIIRILKNCEQGFSGHSGQAQYAAVENFKIGIKRRHKDELNYWRVEPIITSYLWRPSLPISSFLLIIGETEYNITYLVEDFGSLVDGIVQNNETEDEIKRIKKLCYEREVGLFNLSMAYSSNHPKWKIVVHDLDPGASFSGEFDKRGLDIFRDRKSKYDPLLNIEKRIYAISLAKQINLLE